MSTMQNALQKPTVNPLHRSSIKTGTSKTTGRSTIPNKVLVIAAKLSIGSANLTPLPQTSKSEFGNGPKSPVKTKRRTSVSGLVAANIVKTSQKLTGRNSTVGKAATKVSSWAQKNPKKAILFTTGAAVVSQIAKTLVTSQVIVNRTAKQLGSTGQFLKELAIETGKMAGDLGSAAQGVAAMAGLINFTALAAGLYKASVTLAADVSKFTTAGTKLQEMKSDQYVDNLTNQINDLKEQVATEMVSGNIDEVTKLDNKINDLQSELNQLQDDPEYLENKIKVQEDEVSAKSEQVGKSARRWGAAAMLFMGSIPGALSGVATIAALTGSPAAAAIGAVAGTVAATAIAPIGLIVGGVATIVMNSLDGYKNVTNLNEAKNELASAVENLNSIDPSNADDLKVAEKKVAELEKKIDGLQAKWNANKKGIATGVGLSLAGAGLAAAMITGVGAPIVVGVGLAIAGFAIGSSGDPVKDVSSGFTTVKDFFTLPKSEREAKLPTNVRLENKLNELNSKKPLNQADTELEKKLLKLQGDMGLKKVGKNDYGEDTFSPTIITKATAKERFNDIMNGVNQNISGALE